jgi:6-phosphogluconolactonase
MVRKYICRDQATAARMASAYILERLERALATSEFATLALSGGATPKPMFDHLAAAHMRWAKVHFFWVDERAVPPNDARSNYRMAAESLLIPARVPQANIHRIRAELVPAAAAHACSEDIRTFFGLQPGEMPRFDVLHRGIGPDAHTASLFPGEPLIDDRQGIAAAVWVAKLAEWRITLLPGVLLSAADTVMLAAGEDKAEAVRAVFQEPYEPRRYPAQLGTRDGKPTSWFLDEPAAKLLESL